MRRVGAGWCYWVDDYLDHWRRQGASPLWLLFPPGPWGRAHEVRTLLEPWAAGKGVSTVWQAGFFCLPLDVAADLVVRRIADRLKELVAELTELGPRGQDTDGVQ